ncbi:MAG TPA: hypothetical protein VF960_03095 [Chloroflexota bacterium]
MYARVVTFRGQPNKIQEGLRKLEDSIPTLRRIQGFQDLYCLTDQKTGNCVIVALWDSEQLLQRGSDAVQPVRDDVTRAFGSSGQPKIEVYEVSHSPGQAMRKAA